MDDHIKSVHENGYLVYQDNTKQERKVIRLEDRYRKVWYGKNPEHLLATNNLAEHIRLLNKFMPGYVLDHGFNDNGMFIDYEILPGKQMGKIDYSDELVDEVYDYCLRHLLNTWPYSYLEWNRWNVLIDGKSIYLVDWDSIYYARIKYSFSNMINLLDNKFKKHFPKKGK